MARFQATGRKEGIDVSVSTITSSHRTPPPKSESPSAIAEFQVQSNETTSVVRDLHEVIVSMCARLYGKRAAANKARKALEVIQRGELPESCDSSTSDA